MSRWGYSGAHASAFRHEVLAADSASRSLSKHERACLAGGFGDAERPGRGCPRERVGHPEAMCVRGHESAVRSFPPRPRSSSSSIAFVPRRRGGRPFGEKPAVPRPRGCLLDFSARSALPPGLSCPSSECASAAAVCRSRRSADMSPGRKRVSPVPPRNRVSRSGPPPSPSGRRCAS